MTPIILMMAFLISSSSSEAQDRTKIEEKKLEGELFLLNNRTLITNLKIDPKKYNTNNNRILSVPVEILSSANLKENDVVQSISFMDGKVKEYKLGKNVFVLLMDKEGDEIREKWTSFNLILSDNVEEHKTLLKLEKINPIQGNGLAYSRKDLIFKNGSYDTLAFTKLSINDPKRKIFFKPKNDIRVGSTNHFSLYIDLTPEGPWHTNLISTSKDNFLLSPVNLILEKNEFSAQVGNFSKDFQFLLSLIVPDMKCSRIYFITKENVLFKDVFCGEDKE